MNTQPRSLEIDRKSTFAFFALLAGVLSLLLVIVHLQPALYPTTAAQQLSTFTSNQASYVLLAFVALFWSVFSIPFVVGLGTLLRAKSRSLVIIAAVIAPAEGKTC